jgi:imidazolonepropionase-like amidohydrolase
MPGLIDNHVHIVMTVSTQAEMLDPKATFASIEAKGSEEAKQMLLRGFTTVRDLGGPSFGIKQTIDAGKAVGPRIYPSGAMISQTSGHGDSRLPMERSRRFFAKPSIGEEMGFNFIADGRDEVLTATCENLRHGASQIKVMAGGGAASTYDPLDVTQHTLDEMKAAVDAAEDWNTYVTVHAYTPCAAPLMQASRSSTTASCSTRRRSSCCGAPTSCSTPRRTGTRTRTSSGSSDGSRRPRR